MEKNTIWAIVLSTLVIVVFSFIQINSIQPAQPVEAPAATDNVEVVDVSATNNTQEVSEIDIGNFPDLKEEEIVISTDLISVKLTNKGGDIVDYFLLDHKDGDKYVDMVDNESDENRAFSIALGNEKNNIINDLFYVEKIDDTSYIITWEEADDRAKKRVKKQCFVSKDDVVQGRYICLSYGPDDLEEKDKQIWEHMLKTFKPGRI